MVVEPEVESRTYHGDCSRPGQREQEEKNNYARRITGIVIFVRRRTQRCIRMCFRAFRAHIAKEPNDRIEPEQNVGQEELSEDKRNDVHATVSRDALQRHLEIDGSKGCHPPSYHDVVYDSSQRNSSHDP